MDLDIGENPVASFDQRDDEDEDSIKMQIDQRLKMIQNEEEMPGVSSDGDITEEERIIRHLKGEDINEGKQEKTKQEKTVSKEEAAIDIEPVSVPVANAPKPNSLSKIYIGQFSDMQKAVDMQSNILSSGLNVNTIIKEVNGYYTIQAGVFTSYESAKNLADQLNNAGFSAKIVKELR